MAGRADILTGAAVLLVPVGIGAVFATPRGGAAEVAGWAIGFAGIAAVTVAPDTCALDAGRVGGADLAALATVAAVESGVHAGVVAFETVGTQRRARLTGVAHARTLIRGAHHAAGSAVVWIKGEINAYTVAVGGNRAAGALIVQAVLAAGAGVTAGAAVLGIGRRVDAVAPAGIAAVRAAEQSNRAEIACSSVRVAAGSRHTEAVLANRVRPAGTATGAAVVRV